MNCLELIHKNNTGSVFYVKDIHCESAEINSIQLQIGEVAILMEANEMKGFLAVVRSARKKCTCVKCSCNSAYRIIKCDTIYAEVKIKATSKIIDDLEELILAVIYNKQMHNILYDNNIS